MTPATYQWTTKDEARYTLSLIPFIIVFIGSAYLLSTYSIWLTAALIGMYLLTNVFQAGCCIGCPYPGKYCPALFGVYWGTGSLVSSTRTANSINHFSSETPLQGGTMVMVIAIFPLYWVWKTNWVLIPVYLVLVAAHLLLFMPTQCEKCSFNTTCPGGKAWLSCRKMLKDKE